MSQKLSLNTLFEFLEQMSNLPKSSRSKVIILSYIPLDFPRLLVHPALTLPLGQRAGACPHWGRRIPTVLHLRGHTPNSGAKKKSMFNPSYIVVRMNLPTLFF